MIKEYSGTVFNSGAAALVNTVNIMGVMGAGIALEFSLRYPEMFKDYKRKCKDKLLATGHVDYYTGYNNPIIVNFPTKWNWKYPSKIQWIEEGLKDFCKTYQSYGFSSVAFPKLGCLNGKLEWSDVYPLMKKYLDPLEITVYICLDSEPQAQGKEREMVEAYNQSDLFAVCQTLKIDDSTTQQLIKLGPIDRFWKLSKESFMEAKYYKKLFNFFYSANSYPGDNAPHQVEQMSIFD